MVIRFCVAKSGTRGNQPQKAAAEKPCSDQNHKRRGNFADHQKATKPLAGARTTMTARAGAQCLLEISPSGAPGGKQPERKRPPPQLRLKRTGEPSC